MHELAAHGLAHAHKKDSKKHLKEFHVKELHDGTFGHQANDGKGGMTEGSATTLDQVKEALQAHLSPPDEGTPAVDA